MAGGDHPLNPTGEGKDGLYVQTGGAGKSFPVPASQLVASDPDLIVFAPCGMSLAASRAEAERLGNASWWQDLRAVREGRVYVVVSWGEKCGDGRAGEALGRPRHRDPSTLAPLTHMLLNRTVTRSSTGLGLGLLMRSSFW